jgi:hypothetical protein
MCPPSTSTNWCINTGIFRSARLKTSVQILLAPAYFIFQICDIFDILRMTGADMIHTETPQAIIYWRLLKVAFSMMWNNKLVAKRRLQFVINDPLELSLWQCARRYAFLQHGPTCNIGLYADDSIQITHHRSFYKLPVTFCSIVFIPRLLIRESPNTTICGVTKRWQMKWINLTWFNEINGNSGRNSSLKIQIQNN